MVKKFTIFLVKKINIKKNNCMKSKSKVNRFVWSKVQVMILYITLKVLLLDKKIELCQLRTIKYRTPNEPIF